MYPDSDFMIRAVLKEHAIRIAFGNFKNIVTSGVLKHDTDPVAARLLGGALTAGALMSVLLNEEERYSIRIDCDGPAGGVMLDVSGRGDVRGFIRNAHVMTQAASIEEAGGNESSVTVTKSENGKVLNSGQAKSAFILPEAALAYFLSVSDQVETEIRADILFRPEPVDPVRCAVGIMLQALPGCDLEFFNKVREKLFAEAAGSILTSGGVSPEQQLRELMTFLCDAEQAPALEIAEVPAPRFNCPCSAKKLWETAKVMLGKEDFEKLLQENPDPEIKCQFCNSNHRYSSSLEG